MVSGLAEGLFELAYMVVIAGLDLYAQQAAVDRCGFGVALVGNGDDIGSVLAQDAAYSRELTGFVADIKLQGVVAAALDESACDDAVEAGDVDVAA